MERDTHYQLEYGKIMELMDPNNPMPAYRAYSRALVADPANEEAKKCLDEVQPRVDTFLNAKLSELNEAYKLYEAIPRSNPGLNQALKDLYFRHIFETNAIEGNKLTLEETKNTLLFEKPLELKSKDEKEVAGIKEAMQILENPPSIQDVNIEDILWIHGRVLSQADPDIAGKIRDGEVRIGRTEATEEGQLQRVLDDFIGFLNDPHSVDTIHPVELACFAQYYYPLQVPTFNCICREEEGVSHSIDGAINSYNRDSREFVRHLVEQMTNHIQDLISHTWTDSSAAGSFSSSADRKYEGKIINNNYGSFRNPELE
uniref:Uncharacterized protein n=1 Tax=Ditylenchus dipsaci TaxID=166011 RepID=A0A915ECZ2_9BILA